MAEPGDIPKKIEEMRRILGDHLPDVVVLGADDVAPYVEPVEDHPTFEGNALLKAHAGLAATAGLGAGRPRPRRRWTRRSRCG